MLLAPHHVDENDQRLLASPGHGWKTTGMPGRSARRYPSQPNLARVTPTLRHDVSIGPRRLRFGIARGGPRGRMPLVSTCSRAGLRQRGTIGSPGKQRSHPRYPAPAGRLPANPALPRPPARPSRLRDRGHCIASVASSLGPNSPTSRNRCVGPKKNPMPETWHRIFGSLQGSPSMSLAALGTNQRTCASTSASTRRLI